MDVLAYSAFNRRAELDAQLNAKQTCLTALRNCVSAKQAEERAASANVSWLQADEAEMLCNPHKFENYQSKIEDTELTTGSGFKVCNTLSQFNCGASCTWTVPAGTTCARFQIWGAGGGSGPGCCCGGSPFGSTGAYATVSMPVVPGCSYTLCSGCAYCCFPSTGTCGRLPGCPSYVTGHGLTNFCADGGQGRIGTMLAMYGIRCICRIANLNQSSNYGSNLCNRGADYCFYSSCATCGKVGCFIPGATYFGSSHCGAIVKGVRGMWPVVCYDTNHYGYELAPPVYGHWCCYHCFSYSSGNCCGCLCSAKCNCFKFPGMGGWASHVMGGATGICGDMGRMGMVCVTYC